MQLWPPEKGQTRKFCGRRGVGGGGCEFGGREGRVVLAVAGGCLAAAAPLRIVSPKRGRGLYLSVAAGG